MRRGNARPSLRRVDEAIADYAQASTLDPVNPFFALQRSEALMFSAPRLNDAEREPPSATQRAYLITRRNLPVRDSDNPLNAFSGNYGHGAARCSLKGATRGDGGVTEQGALNTPADQRDHTYTTLDIIGSAAYVRLECRGSSTDSG